MSFVARETMVKRSDFGDGINLNLSGCCVVENFDPTATAKHIAHAKER